MLRSLVGSEMCIRDRPTGQPEPEQRARPNVQPQTAQDPGINLQQAEELPAPFQQQQDPQQRLESDLEEQQRHAVPDMRARWAAGTQPSPLAASTASAKVDGGIFDRANKMASAVEDKLLVPPVSLANTEGFKPAQQGESGPNIANAIAEKKDGSIQAAVNRVGAVDYTDVRNPVIDPDFVKAGSLVTENMIMEFAAGADLEAETTQDPVSAALQENQAPIDFANTKVKRIAKQQGNARIGKQIATEYQRLKGNPTPESDITPAEAESLGDAFKMMWAAQNPNLVKVTSDNKTRQNYLELTPEGENVLAQGAADRKRLFPTVQVRPAKNPVPGNQLRGDVGLNITKKVQGRVGDQQMDPTTKEAMRNLAQVPNVVDKQRLKILFSTALPVLKTIGQGGEQRWEATINNIGKDKLAKYTAKHGKDIAQGEMVKAAQKLANEVQSIAQERNGANYLTYAMQGFQGRISPQQDPNTPHTPP